DRALCVNNRGGRSVWRGSAKGGSTAARAWSESLEEFRDGNSELSGTRYQGARALGDDTMQIRFTNSCDYMMLKQQAAHYDAPRAGAGRPAGFVPPSAPTALTRYT